jgi:hypothetical protein
MNQSHHPYWRNFWVGLAGFCLGGIIGAFSLFIFASGVMDVIAGFISPDNPMSGSCLESCCIYWYKSWGQSTAGAGILHLIDPIDIRRRYLLGGHSH